MDTEFDTLADGSYRGYGGGYKIDCYSALGLIGLLGLLEILRDLVDDVTDMRKRSVHTNGLFGLPVDIVRSFGDQLPYDIVSNFPGAVLPLLNVVADVNDGLSPPSCLELAFCQSNRALLQERPLNTSSKITSNLDDGFWNLKALSRWKAAQYMTEVLSKSFLNTVPANELSPTTNPEMTNDVYIKAVEDASEAGRNGADCEKIFPECVKYDL